MINILGLAKAVKRGFKKKKEMYVGTKNIQLSEFFFEQRWFLCLYLANRCKNLNEVAMNIQFSFNC